MRAICACPLGTAEPLAWPVPRPAQRCALLHPACAVIYPLSYWTFQLATPDKDPKSVRILNRLGQDLQSTGFAKVARALDPMPQVYYDSADLAA